jgi:hypothetical protein
MYEERKNEVGVQLYSPQFSNHPHPFPLISWWLWVHESRVSQEVVHKLLVPTLRNTPRLQLPALVLRKPRLSTSQTSIQKLALRKMSLTFHSVINIQLEYLELTVRRREVGEVLIVAGRAPACWHVWRGMQYKEECCYDWTWDVCSPW